MIGPLSYIGGKRRLAKTICELIPEHTTYVEPFSGGAQVFFCKEPSKVEILNDLSDDIVTFFRVCQHHYSELLNYLKFMLVGRSWFDLLYKTNPANLTDIQKAARFFYLQKTAYAGLVTRKNFALYISQPPRFNLESIPELIEKTHKRLQKVQIESLPYQDVMAKTDRKDTFFYLDPPYWGKKYYHYNLSETDFEEMGKLLGGLKGKFLLSINDVPAVKRIFDRFKIRTVNITYTAPPKTRIPFKELLISNY